MSQNLKYTCTNCGSKVGELYKKYNSSVLKLISCDKCYNIADKYIEYDPVIIMIDLVLLQKEAYRHMLFNMEFKNHWKLAILLLLMEAFSEWMLLTPSSSENKSNNKTIITNLDDLNTGDLEFYQICIKVAFKNACFVGVLMLLTIIYNKFVKRAKEHSKILFTVWKAITISSFGIFLLLPSLIWDENVIHEFHLTFVSLYQSLSQLLAYTVALECSKMWSIFVILLSHYSKAVSVDVYYWIENNLYSTW